jgi:hypothetical protein
MPDIVLDYHRLKTPIDHPDLSVTPEKLSFGTFQKIAEVDVPSGSTAVDISGLNGDIDKIYMIIFSGEIVGDGASPDTYLLIIPNALSLSIENLEHGIYFDGSTVAGISYRFLLGGILIMRTGWYVTVRGVCSGFLHAKTGIERNYVGKYHTNVPAKANNVLCTVGGFWSDTTTNITSLRIATNKCSFNGKLILFKVI